MDFRRHLMNLIRRNPIAFIAFLSFMSLASSFFFGSVSWNSPLIASLKLKLDHKLYYTFFREPSCKLIAPMSDSVPAIYVFGDSTVDPGNNNNFKKAPQANFFPYGIDFNKTGTATGRFTNGKTIADYLAMCYGLPFPPPYMNSTESVKKQSLKGVNYASGGCGLLSDTRPLGKEGCFDMKTQIESFESTLQKDLPYMIEDKEKRSRYLAASMFFISIGSNDFIFNPHKDEDNFGDLLSQEMYSSMKTLYELGARSFTITNVGPLGCIPEKLDSITKLCNKTLNDMVKQYNKKLPLTLQRFQNANLDFKFILADVDTIVRDILENPKHYGFSHITEPCCGSLHAEYDNRYMCGPSDIPCKNRDEYLFFDPNHPSEYANCIFATKVCHRSS